nr:hypothetical protein [Tanacetum cinerariifolium]
MTPNVEKAREVLAAEGSASRKPSVHKYFKKRQDSKTKAESSTCASLDAQLSQSQKHRMFSLGKCKILDSDNNPNCSDTRTVISFG